MTSRCSGGSDFQRFLHVLRRKAVWLIGGDWTQPMQMSPLLALTIEQLSHGVSQNREDVRVQIPDLRQPIAMPGQLNEDILDGILRFVRVVQHDPRYPQQG